MVMSAIENVLAALKKTYKSSVHSGGSIFVPDELILATIVVLEAARWHGADKRPPREGKYLVFGLTHFVPDHIDMPNAFWEMKIEYWSNSHGWHSDKVKYWRELPDMPDGIETKGLCK